jgi:hypothetical protein
LAARSPILDLRDLNLHARRTRVRASIASVEIDQVADLIHELAERTRIFSGVTRHRTGINFAEQA